MRKWPIQKWTVPLVLISVFTVSVPAWAFRLSVVATGTRAKIDSEPNSPTREPKLGFGGGMLMEFDAAPMVGFETGALYVARTFEQGSPAQTYNYNYLMIPALLRVTALDFLTFGAGGYYAAAMGDVKYAGASTSWNAANAKKSDYGVTGALGLLFDVGPLTALRIEGRYNHGLMNIEKNSTNGSTSKWREILFIAGLTFGM